MVTSEKGSGNYKDLDKTQVKLFPNFTSIPFDYLLISRVTNYVSNLGFDMFILDRIDRYLLESFLMCSFVCSDFLKRSFYALASSYMTF